MIQLPNNEKCYNLPEQVAQNLLNIKYLAEQYANIDSLPAAWKAYKDEFDEDFDTFGDWTTTFEGWNTTLSTYLVNMSSAAVGAIAGQNIAPGNISATGTITGASIIENMVGYSFTITGASDIVKEINFAGVVKNGNKITFVMAGVLKRLSTFAGNAEYIGRFNFPSEIGAKLYPNSLGQLDNKIVSVFSGNESSVNLYSLVGKIDNTGFMIRFYNLNTLTQDTEYGFRYECTFLLSDNLAV